MPRRAFIRKEYQLHGAPDHPGRREVYQGLGRTFRRRAFHRRPRHREALHHSGLRRARPVPHREGAHYQVLRPRSSHLDPFSCYPRDVAGKAEEYLASTGIADTCGFDAKTEFYLFDSVRFSTDTNTGFYEVDSNEGWWNRGRATNLDGTPNTGYKTRTKGRSFPTSQSP